MKDRYGNLQGKDAFRLGVADGKLFATEDYVKKESKKRQKKLEKQRRKNKM